MPELLVASFVVQNAVGVIQREYQIFHVEGIPPSRWQATPYKRVRKNMESRYLACRGINFCPPEGASCLLGLEVNISEASLLLVPLLPSRAPPYNEVLGWLQ